ncbi:MAG: c-type cytochrome, partial [Planctomycetaceae bacterium]|nr:c-type cytochrome [Planctomycetaceae bacterium]
QYPQELEEPNQRLCELLAYLEWLPLVEKTIPRLEQAVEQEDKLAYLTTLRNVPVGWTLDLRRRYFAELRKADLFDGGNLLPIAVNGIREDALAMLSADERRELGTLLEPAAENGGDIATLTTARPVVREWKLEELEAAVKNTTAPRDVARGEKLFRETLCLRCHRVGTEGRTIGPDLTFVASRFGPRDLLEHILVPSKVIDGKYRQTIVETKSGQVLAGRVVGGDSSNLLVAPDPLRPTKVTKIPLNDIEARKASTVSPMPAGMLNSLTEPEILDLLEYLRIGRR